MWNLISDKFGFPRRMKILSITIKFICLLILVGFINSCGKVVSQSSRMHEVENQLQADRQAPAECLAVFREFFAYVKKYEPSIVIDEAAQNRWLTKKMRRAFVEHIKRSGKPEENPDYPSNSAFVGVWNEPTTYSIVGSRHYDFRNAYNPNDNRAIIDVLYEWDDEDSIENQYRNEKQLFSFIFVFEDGAWKLDDFYTYDDEYARPESLRQYFSKQ
jgi:Na+-transporting methylmalonyl-CoA/oxaloacetate decarboxylase gamma subunit